VKGGAREAGEDRALESEDALEPEDAPTGPKVDLYRGLLADVERLLEGERDLLANAANTASLIYHALPELNWAGFYLVREGELVVGPFQGKPACTRIAFGKGVCGTAAAEGRTIVVENVHEFPGHIACDAASNSEIVVPIIKQGRLIGRFDADDRAGLEALVEVFLAKTEVGSGGG